MSSSSASIDFSPFCLLSPAHARCRTFGTQKNLTCVGVFNEIKSLALLSSHPMISAPHMIVSGKDAANKKKEKIKKMLVACKGRSAPNLRLNRGGWVVQ